MNRQFAEAEFKADKRRRGYSNSLAIRELEIETTRRHHFAPIKLRTLGGLDSVQCGQGHTDVVRDIQTLGCLVATQVSVVPPVLKI